MATIFLGGKAIGTASTTYSFADGADEHVPAFGKTAGTYTAECEVTVTDEGRAFFAELAALTRPSLQVTYTPKAKLVRHAPPPSQTGRARSFFRAIRRHEAKMRRASRRPVVLLLPPGTEITYEMPSAAVARVHHEMVESRQSSCADMLAHLKREIGHRG